MVGNFRHFRKFMSDVVEGGWCYFVPPIDRLYGSLKLFELGSR